MGRRLTWGSRMKPARRFLIVAVAVLGIAAASGGVSKAAASTTSLSTQAVPSSALGGSVSDTATLEGGTAPTGTVTFNLYGPDDTSCAFPAVFTSTVPVVGTQATSGDFAPMAPGAYRWTASYSGDVANGPVTEPCNAANESSTVQSPTGSLFFNDTAPPEIYTD